MTDTVTKLGLGLAATGAAHFFSPESFEALTAQAFPEDTSTWISINGACELGLGLGLALPATRRLAALGLLAYVGHLVYRGGTAQAGAGEPGTLHAV